MVIELCEVNCLNRIFPRLFVRAMRAISPSLKYSSVIGLCLSAGQILSSYDYFFSEFILIRLHRIFYAKEFINPSYLKFLKIHGSLNYPAMESWLVNGQHGPLCSAFHGTGPCTHWWATFGTTEFGR